MECFVIQPFDNDRFDRRYIETFEPAIRAAGLEPYRVDKDLAVNDLIEGIKDGIDRASAVLADITLDNPNVWYELGHAVAKTKPFCLICSDERTGKYPFDISHLKVTRYMTGSLSDFQKLNGDITARLKAVYSTSEQLRALATNSVLLENHEDLDAFEQAALTLIFKEHLEGGITSWKIKQSMERAGFTKPAATLGIINLIHRGFVIEKQVTNYDGEFYDVLAITDEGIRWIRSHANDFLFGKKITAHSQPDYADASITDDDMPF